MSVPQFRKEGLGVTAESRAGTVKAGLKQRGQSLGSEDYITQRWGQPLWLLLYPLGLSAKGLVCLRSRG